MIEFGIKDYIKMFNTRGIRLPIYYFIENHLFDIKRGVDTHRWLPKDKFDVENSNFEHGTLYMCSWSGIVKKTFNFLLKYLGDKATEYTFVDVGSGKGKVLIIWEEILQKKQINIKTIGVDYYDYLGNIATENYNKLFNKNIEIIISDILDLDLDKYGDNICFYLYNPFDYIVMGKFIQKIENKNSILIYNNPEYIDLLIKSGFSILKEKKSWHYNGNYVILERKKFK